MMISLIRNATDVCRAAASSNLKIIQISTLILRPSRRRVLSVLGTTKRLAHGPWRARETFLHHFSQSCRRVVLGWTLLEDE
ncbi:hypothetical protein CY35_19G003300 [Sphagnum magellanicum]|nr:hypothetical protein CY35_19G003300 [Sphagnum magellanicum]